MTSRDEELETRVAVTHDPATLPGEACGEGLSPGTRLGPWRVERLIGRGGMGEVYEAQRADGTFELRAAVKLLKRGLDTVAVVGRFNRERRILAQLDHPNIAHVLDAGVAADGRPFLVMEYVDGQPVTEYLREREPPVAELLRLMITVCEAVQAAHARHIVHRDLKPSNVLVTPQGQVKLLDFGIAKALAEDDTESTRLVGEGTAMTPAYAAPEQLLGLPTTPATDVYALGVILYQLLVARLPHARSGRSTHDILRTLQRETAERPSTVLRRDRGRLPEPLRLDRLKSVSRDLDLIVLKALHGDPQRRYADGHEFADDLRRLLEHRPIRARPESARYRAARFIRRNRVMVASAAAIMLALAGGLGATLWQARAALLARNEATHRREQADDLINFMLGDLKDRLDEVGRLDVLDSTISKTLGYVGSGDPRTMDDETLAERITALDQIAGIQVARGELKTGLASAHAAVDAARQLRQRHADPRSEQLLAAALFRLADAADQAGDYATSQPLLAQGLEISQRRLAAQPDNQALSLLVARYDGALAENFDFGPQVDRQQADRHWRACIDRLQPLAQRADAAPRLLEQLMDCRHGWMVSTFNDSRFEVAAQAASSFLDQAVTLQRYADDSRLQLVLLQGLGAAAAELVHLGHADSAERASTLALQIGRQLTALEPGNMDWLRSYAGAVDFDLGVKLEKQAWAEAQADADQGLPLFQRALLHFPDDVGFRMEAMQFRGDRAKLAFNQGHKEVAVAEATAGLALLRDTDEGTEMLEGGKMSLLLRQWYYALNVDPQVVQQAQLETYRVLAQLSTRPDARNLDLYSTMAAYLSGNCAAGDRMRDQLVAEHHPWAASVQKMRVAGCGGKGK